MVKLIEFVVARLKTKGLFTAVTNIKKGIKGLRRVRPKISQNFSSVLFKLESHKKCKPLGLRLKKQFLGFKLFMFYYV